MPDRLRQEEEYQVNHKVLLVSIDGLRPDAVMQCKHPFLHEFMTRSCTYSFHGRSVIPPITLPCHMSMFHSVVPDRHGVLDNLYLRPAHHIDGLCEVLERGKKKCAFCYTWAELRDLCRPGSLALEDFRNYFKYEDQADRQMCARTVELLQTEKPDFIFYYTGHTDEVAHKYGWMTPEYMDAVALASEHMEQIVQALPPEYTMIITADHGGHGRNHGQDVPEDMTIPISLYGAPWEKGKELPCIRLIDLAPTIVDLLGCEIPGNWDGTSLCR